MMKKICPVCDLPVNEMNYCPRCRRVVRRPVMREVNYYLNEKRPDMPAAGHSTVRPSQTKGRENTGTKYILIISGILIFCIILSAVSGIVRMGAGILESEMAVQYDDSGYTEFNEEDVIAAGERCSGYEHFPADGKQIADTMGQFLDETDYGYTIELEDIYCDNYEFQEEEGSISYYETIESFTFEDETTEQLDYSDENYVYQYMDINYDTATGELHDYVSSLKNPEASLAYLEQFLTLTETAAGISPEESSIPGIMDQARAGIAQEEGTFILEGIFNINIYQEEEGVRVYVSYNDPQAAKDERKLNEHLT